MEDLFFILIAVGWLLYSFFYGKKKKSRPTATEDNEDYYQPEADETEAENSSFFESIFDDDVEIERDQPYQPYTNSKEQTDYTPVSGNTNYLDSERKWEKTGDNKEQKAKMELASNRFIPLDSSQSYAEQDFIEGESMLEDEIHGRDIEKPKVAEDIDFELRKAIIFSEILNRPY